jgi:hypothetical protein
VSVLTTTRVAPSCRRISNFPFSICALLLVLLGCAPSSTFGAIRYVWKESPNPTAPYTNWNTAARVIQSAINVARPGDTVLVTNGVYNAGGRAVFGGTVTNRIAITQAITVKSVNGPAVTWIVGTGVGPGKTNHGYGAIRCAYVGTNAVLSGFTLTSGRTRAGTGDWFKERSGGGVWSETSGIVTNCVLTGNSAFGGGGGSYQGTLYNCIFTGNSADDGGGSLHGTLYNCTFTGNFARLGGGASSGILNNCTLVGNSAEHFGGGSYRGVLNNSIVYYNTAHQGSNHYGGTFNHSCTTPLPLGANNINSEPLLASTLRLSSSSPCIGRGSVKYSIGLDMDKQPWSNPPCIGADQFVSANLTGPLSVSITASYRNVATGFPINFVGKMKGRVQAGVWDFGDGIVVSNKPYVSHAWSAPGNYPVRLTCYNTSNPSGVTATQWVRIDWRSVHYVNATNPAPASPYTTWATAARTIQQAIDSASAVPGTLVLVTNGVYDTGGKVVHTVLTNRVVIDKPIIVQSVNGPAVTFIVGSAGSSNIFGDIFGPNAIRCAYVGTNAVLRGFTLTNGHTHANLDWKERSGGGAWCETSGTLHRCILTGNRSDEFGGGCYSGSVNDCVLTNNWGLGGGGGAYFSRLYNSTLVANRNSAGGGGASVSELSNCVLSNNMAAWGGGSHDSILMDCSLLRNSVEGDGGGSNGDILSNCRLIGNIAGNGGGAYGSTLDKCSLIGNSADSGGGSSVSTLDNCVITGNSARYAGGGSIESTLTGCTLTGNSARGNGGGAFGGTLNNSVLTANVSDRGGGSFDATLNNCTLTGNSATNEGGGSLAGFLNNCIVYYNTASFGPNHFNYSSNRLNHSCTTPLPVGGTGNITNAPAFVNRSTGNLRLQASSPCINAGDDSVIQPGWLDRDGKPRIVGAHVDMGAYEFQSVNTATLAAADFDTSNEIVRGEDANVFQTTLQTRDVTSFQWYFNGSLLTRHVFSQPNIAALNLTSPGFQVIVDADPGRAYWLEKRTNLIAGDWHVVSGITNFAGRTNLVDTNVFDGQRFYRVGSAL